MVSAVLGSTLAGSALSGGGSTALFADDQVVSDELMSSKAVSLSGVVCDGAIPPHGVLCSGDDLHVVDVHAPPSLEAMTDVVDRKPFRNGSDLSLPGETMCVLPAVEAIPCLLVLGSRPKKTSLGSGF